MKRHIILSIFTFLLLTATIVSCNDKWNEHYSEENGNDQDIIEYLKSNEGLSRFVEMLEITGYADTLKKTQAFTVFAPLNESMQDVDLTDMDMLRKIVSNHIAKNTHAASAGSQELILMSNKKYLLLDPNSIEGKTIKIPNIRTKNGVIHVLSEYVPYNYNIWEYIQYQEGLDSLRTYVNSLTSLVFDVAASYDANSILIDSVFKEENKVIKLLGLIDTENHFYTAILPTNTAWNDTYGKLFPYYRSTDKMEGNIVVQDGLSRQVERTKWAIIQDFIFQKELTVPTGKDTLYSTNGNVFHHPDYLFEGLTPNKVSNGLCYVTNQLRNKPEESWTKEIVQEAEYNEYNLVTIKNSKSQSYYRNKLASNGYFFRMEELSTSSLDKISITFPVVNTLSGLKYNVYCAMVPPSFLDPADLRPYKVDFYLSYVRENGVMSESKVNTTSVVVDSDQITEVLVAENVVFPYCNLLEGEDAQTVANGIKVFLKIENAATPSEERMGRFSRNMAFDYIILKPVID